MKMWRKVFINGIAPSISNSGLVQLIKELAMEPSSLIQRETVFPEPIAPNMDRPVEAACAIGFCGWKGEGCETVAEVIEYFSRVCYETDQRLCEEAGCRWFINWFDDTDMEIVREELTSAIVDVLRTRALSGLK